MEGCYISSGIKIPKREGSNGITLKCYYLGNLI